MSEILSELELAERSGKAQLARVYEVTKCRTQLELAQRLGIRQSSVSDAKRRGCVPANWLVVLMRAGVNLEWITTGIGSQYITQDADSIKNIVPYQAPPQKESVEKKILRNILRYFPSQDLVDELDRRKTNAPIYINSAAPSPALAEYETLMSQDS